MNLIIEEIDENFDFCESTEAIVRETMGFYRDRTLPYETALKLCVVRLSKRYNIHKLCNLEKERLLREEHEKDQERNYGN